MHKKITTAVVFSLLPLLGFAQNNKSAVTAITPIFNQLVMFSYPKGFEIAFEEAKGSNYIQESVLAGETVKKWSQMITVTGHKGLALNPAVSPKVLAEMVSNGFRNVCPDSFNSVVSGDTKIDGHDAFVTLASCGTNPTQRQSESTLIIALKGEKDIYTIQWAERGPASDKPLKFAQNKWAERIQALRPIKLCAKVPGESAPYPSCHNRP